MRDATKSWDVAWEDARSLRHRRGSCLNATAIEASCCCSGEEVMVLARPGEHATVMLDKCIPLSRLHDTNLRLVHYGESPHCDSTCYESWDGPKPFYYWIRAASSSCLHAALERHALLHAHTNSRQRLSFPLTLRILLELCDLSLWDIALSMSP